MTKSGSVLVEGCCVLFIGLILFSFMLDVVRRTRLELLLKHVCFIYVRQRAFGDGKALSRAKIEAFLRRSLGKVGEKLMARLQIQEELTDHLFVRLSYYYPAYLRFPYRGVTKHHLEPIQKCSFPL